MEQEERSSKLKIRAITAGKREVYSMDCGSQKEVANLYSLVSWNFKNG